MSWTIPYLGFSQARLYSVGEILETFELCLDNELLKYGGDTRLESLTKEELSTIAVTCSLVSRYLNGGSGVLRSSGVKIIRLSILNSEKVNAIAYSDSKTECLAITRGLLTTLLAVSKVSMTLPGFLQDCVDSELPVTLSFEESCNPSTVFEFEDWPDDRVMATYDLFRRAIEFLVCHELAHLARDHPGYLLEHSYAPVNDERLALSISLDDGFGDVIRQLEFDADLHGLDLLLCELDDESTVANLDFTDQVTEAHLYGVSILGLYLCLDSQRTENTVTYKHSHPPPIHRAVRVLHALMSFFGDASDWDDQVIRALHDECWSMNAEVAIHLGFPMGRWHGENLDQLELHTLWKQEDPFFKVSKELDKRNAH